MLDILLLQQIYNLLVKEIQFLNRLEQFGHRTIHGIHETGPGSHITNVAGRMIQTVGRFSTDFYMLGRAGGSGAAHMQPPPTLSFLPLRS